MYFTYKGDTQTSFNFGQAYKMYYIKKYDCYICSDNLMILRPEDLKSDFVSPLFKYSERKVTRLVNKKVKV